jgi:serine/threonine protein kinase
LERLLRDHEFSYENRPKGVPERIGRFTVLQEVSTEQTVSQTSVYEALDPLTGEKVALKVLEDEMHSFAVSIMSALMRDNDIEDIVSESAILSKIQHRNIVSILEVGADAIRGPYIVMEWIEGNTISQLIYSRRDDDPLISPMTCASISIQLLEGLSVVHRHGVIHGDIKPSNILIDVHGVVKLADFGVARLVQLNDGGLFRGTLEYLAPERENFNSPTELSPTVDLYSVGIVMLEMLNGRVPSGFDEIESLILLIPEPLGEIVREATKYHSKDRFISAETMIDALRKFTNEA